MNNTESTLFIDRLAYTDQYVRYYDRKLFFNACCCRFDEGGSVTSSTMSVYLLPSWEEVYAVKAGSPDECVRQFLADRIIDEKTYYELAKDFVLCED